MNISFKDTVIKELIPTLKIREKKTKISKTQNETIEEERTSVFIQRENEILNQMLSGEYTFNQIEKSDNNMSHKMVTKAGFIQMK